MKEHNYEKHNFQEGDTVRFEWNKQPPIKRFIIKRFLRWDCGVELEFPGHMGTLYYSCKEFVKCEAVPLSEILDNQLLADSKA